MKLINIGCGKRFHDQWENYDYSPCDPNIKHCDLRLGIPVESQSADVVYHSHVLEHLDKEDGLTFLKECHRILKIDGILRIAIPDLESIAKLYLEKLNACRNGTQGAPEEREWMLLELIDQTSRHKSGGEVINFISKASASLRAFVFTRWGKEAEQIFNLNKDLGIAQRTKKNSLLGLNLVKKTLAHVFFKTDVNTINIGRFRTNGEVHRWMYDEVGLTDALLRAGFNSIKRVSARESSIQNWNSYFLDSDEFGAVIKPDSLFMEASKMKPNIK